MTRIHHPVLCRALLHRLVSTRSSSYGAFLPAPFPSPPHSQQLLSWTHLRTVKAFSPGPKCTLSSSTSSMLMLSSLQGSAEPDEMESSYRDDYLIPTVSATIICGGDIAEDLMEALMSFGASSVSIEDVNSNKNIGEEDSTIGPLAWDKEKRQFWTKCKITALFPPTQNVEESLAFAFNTLELQEELPYELKKIEHQNWEQQVKDQFQPLKIMENLWIIPKWSAPPDSSATNIILDPGLAFGTGDHPTTRLCLQCLGTVVKGGELILDYGIGSGILAISGLKLGASRAVGVDIDPVAVSSAKQNASLNGFGADVFQVFLADNSKANLSGLESAGFDIVVANILLNPLLELSPCLLGYTKPGGVLALSGILESQVEQVQEKYGEHLENVQVLKLNGWACVNGTRKQQ